MIEKETLQRLLGRTITIEDGGTIVKGVLCLVDDLSNVKKVTEYYLDNSVFIREGGKEIASGGYYTTVTGDFHSRWAVYENQRDVFLVEKEMGIELV